MYVENLFNDVIPTSFNIQCFALLKFKHCQDVVMHVVETVCLVFSKTIIDTDVLTMSKVVLTITVKRQRWYQSKRRSIQVKIYIKN